MHGMAFNSLRDEIIVPQSMAQAIMTFRGAANGEEPPLRVIHGPATQITNPNSGLAIDEVNDELFLPLEDRILVFPAKADGNVAPIRILETPAPEFAGFAGHLAIDPVNNVLVAVPDPVSVRGRPSQILIFDRTASGKAKPRAIIRGPKAMLTGAREVTVHPPRGLILVSVTEKNGEGYDPNNYVGVWSIHDNGDIPPRWTIGGPSGALRNTRGLVLDAKNKSVIVNDKFHNGILTFHFPEIF